MGADFEQSDVSKVGRPQGSTDAIHRDVQDESQAIQALYRLQAEQAAVTADWLASESRISWVSLSLS